VTYLCVPIFVEDRDQATREVALAAESGADMVELRIDLNGDTFRTEFISKLVRDCRLPCIVTCRPAWEGGRSPCLDPVRLDSLKTAATNGASYIDVELQTYVRAGGEVPGKGRLILSAHDFQGRPDRLYNLISEMNAAPAAIVKIAWNARSIRDNLEAFEILQTRQKPTIALCMGEAGMISRVLAKKFGAFLTFASLRDASATAPGQVTIHDMKRLYRWDAINPATKVYGVVASPVMHSMSPAIHNAGFDAVGHDGVYLPLLVNPGYESFKAFMESFLAFEPLDLSGLSITLPHKENALRYLKEKGAEVEALAERIGAVNTIIIERTPSHSPAAANLSPSSDTPGANLSPSSNTPGANLSPSSNTPGANLSPSSNTPGVNPSPSPGTPGEGRGGGLRLRGFNTDYAAILDTITDALGITRQELSRKRVAVIGAGGTGRTAVAALAEYGATVVVYNRTRERAQELAKEFTSNRAKIVAASMEKLCDSCCEIYINTTSIGMHPNVDESPFGENPPELTPQSLVFDAVYNPMQTKLLQQAQSAGAKTVGGVEMFIRQGARQFETWTIKPAPLDLFRRVVEAQLKH
jgi:3-dehydroquinate dehydratase/shikimate dehydrogenase